MKVMTYNVLVGGEDRLDDVAAVIDSERPDAVGLLEATESGTTALAKELGMEAVRAASNHAFARELGIGVAWLSRTPIRRSTHHALPELAKTLLEIEVDGLLLYATHLASRHEIADHPREREVRAIVEVIGHGGDAVFAGDLNALARGDPVGEPPGWVPRSDALPGAPRDVLVPLVEAGYVDCYRALHLDGAGYTFPARAPWLRLDYVFASPGMAGRLRACDVVRTGLARRASDHLPVWAAFD
jgi:exodeoxyribonuclease-3